MLLPAGGQEFGKYLLLDRIAVGGMSEIYRARMTAAAGVTKQVVIKKILPSFADNPAFVSMFVNEARIAAGLSHGNISHVVDFGEVDGEYYLALEWVHGQPLSKVLRRAKDKDLAVLPVPLALRVATEMLRGLEYAHNQLDESGRPLNIIHRDVSPQNVVLGYEGQVKLVDFGIARARLASSADAEASAGQGKYLYFSPEQAMGRELDARADIFAAGVVLYQMLCGRLPWEGERMEVLQIITQGNFPPPRSLNPDVAPELERILLTAMAVERERRYPSAQAFGEALETYLHTCVPDFPASALAHFMGYLFESELVAEGRPVRLPPDFLAQLQQWSRELPDELPRLRTPSRSSLPVPTLPPPPEPPEPPRRRWSIAPWVLFGAPVAAALLAVAFFLTREDGKTFSVELTSTPQGASVWVDGLLLMEHTPTLIPLSADREHLIEVHAIGMESWSQRVRADEGATLAVRANLRPASPRLARQSMTGASVLPPGAQVPNEGTFPLPSFELRPSQHAFLVPPSSAARLRLDPSRTYSLRAERGPKKGSAAGASADTLIYYLEGGASLPARKSFGLLGGQELQVSNAFALYLFVPESPGQAPSGSFQVAVRETASGTGATVMVDTHQHAVTPRPGESYTLRGLDPATTYEVRLRDTARPARTRGIQGEAVGKVLVLQDGGCGAEVGGPWTSGRAHVVERGHPTRFTGMSWLRFTFPDEDLEDNAGALSVEVVTITGPHPQGC
ncbi:protein kinase domain-containing protein [Hyalangium minutum]|uniref:Serine/threonine protein kinase n=1 Tax=Hyalangium minutum TaxID=394096 RepID=A0A085VZX2_9BACT|nr:protein kinase [Hyalangium minutum]KFE60985.1 Serine/threonine protein kinase [Hyalangium minutum]